MPGKPKAPKPGDRIAKVLSRAGIASRREAERMIERGEVAVNGSVITSPALDVLPTDRITVKGAAVAAPEAARLWLYYKPEGLVTSNADEKGRATVFDHLPPDMPRVMAVGRLDLTSEGLLLLTNDGALKRRLELPSTGWLRKYRVRIKGNPTDADLEPLRTGITVEGDRFLPMTVTLDRVQGANAWLTIGLREGKNREIRRAMDYVGLTVNRLIRTSYGPFRLNELQPGEVEELRPKVLREQLGMTEAEMPSPHNAPRKTAAPAAKAGETPGTKRTLKPGEGARQLSEAWQKITRPAKPADRIAPKTGPRTEPKTGPKTGPRPAPRTGGPRKG